MQISVVDAHLVWTKCLRNPSKHYSARNNRTSRHRANTHPSSGDGSPILQFAHAAYTSIIELTETLTVPCDIDVSGSERSHINASSLLLVSQMMGR